MYRFALLVVAVTLLTSSIAQAASYKNIYGAIVDPILDTSGSTHDYSGNNLESGADLTDANLSDANLTEAYLDDADLTGADLTRADLSNLDLTGATLTGAILTGANLHQALLPSAMPSLPVVNGAVVKVEDTLAVSGSVQVDTGVIFGACPIRSPLGPSICREELCMAQCSAWTSMKSVTSAAMGVCSVMWT